MIEGRKQWIWSSEGTKFGLVHQSGLVLSSATILPPTRQWWKNMWPRTMNFPSISCLGWSEKRCNGSCIPFVSPFLADHAVLFCYAPGVSDVFVNSPWPTSTNRLSISTAKEEAFATASRWQDVIFGMTRNQVWMFVCVGIHGHLGQSLLPMGSTYLIYL